jgi:hypothetical protein
LLALGLLAIFLSATAEVGRVLLLLLLLLVVDPPDP